MKYSFVFFLLLAVLGSSCAVLKEKPTAAEQHIHPQEDTAKKAAQELIRRVVGKYAGNFEVEFIPQEEGKDVFEVESRNGKVVLRGNNGVSIASALNHYLKYYTHSSITWNGSNLNLSSPLPVVPQKVRTVSPYKYRYYLNYCTFSYTMPWWDWERWQQEIDWMAMNGINMPLALTGQNAIYRRVYQSMGLTDKDLESFFSGPAYFAWFWMGNLDAWGGPLPVSWMDSHEALQKQILERERGLGMTPILPAFTGHVPPALKNKFPDAKLKKTKWDEMADDVYLMDPDDPMFMEIGKKFIEEQTKAYGTDHLYSSDTFNENRPPSNDSTFLSNVSKKVYQSMAAADPEAVWIMQGWLFHFSADFWKPAQIQAMLNAVPDDKMIILDLYSERHPMWQKTEAYYGKPWIWNMLHNFGGNVSMYGLMDRVATWPSQTLRNPEKGKLTGIGLTPEGIENNPVMYELMMENAWRDTPIELTSWLKDYTKRRYGKENAHANQAWQILRRTVYADSITAGGPESIVTGRPTFNRNTKRVITKFAYEPLALVPAWESLITASDELKSSQGFQYDLVDVTRQVLGNYATQLQEQFARDYKNKDLPAFKKHSTEFIALIGDMDKLLATQEGLLLGRWLHSAKDWGTTPAEKKLYEKNARNLITLWGDKNSNLMDYANRQWAGLLNGFYKPRWQQYFAHVAGQMEKGQDMNQRAFDEKIKTWEWQWVNSNEPYPTKPAGNSVTIAKEMFQKYHKKIKNGYL
ncbi:alpha-N-acetylglucosaminidase [Rufibacter sp. XAAS-G3-1]|uniref:alpha-N-acetylglucosaminidase n=1 Tax=Rufibacter sp. XAAS-G3-1 TaxID=2729134 RepID=UPI0015E78A81|nr:alpha-N-acetylglucosaminidase [Rufibacter sp. XAAS-G3-1]